MQVFEGTSNIDNKQLELNSKSPLLDPAMSHYHLVHRINCLALACFIGL